MKKITLLFTMLLLVAFSWQGNAQFGCASGVVITDGYTASGITTPGTGGAEDWNSPNPTSSCSSSASYWDDDVYMFTYTAGATDEEISMTTFTRSSWNGLGIFTTCSGTALDDCIDSDSSTSSNVSHTVTASIAAGQTVYIATGQWGAPNDLDFDVTAFTVTPLTTPPNCDSTVDVALVSPVTGTVSWSAATGNPTGYFMSVGTATGLSDVLANTDVMNVTSYDVSGLSAATTYYTTITSYNGNGNATGCTEQTFTTSTPPSNDDCGGAISLTVNADFACGTVTSSSLEFASASGVDEAACSGTENDDVWFSFVATGSSNRISLLNKAGSPTDLYHSVWEGSCGGLTLVSGSCSDGDTSNPSLTSGNTYFVRVNTWSSNSGATSTFDICVGTPPAPPANDTMAGATPIVPSVAGTGCSTFTFANSTGSDGTTDSGLDGTCNTTDTGLDRFYTWTATSDALIWNDGAGGPGIVIRDAAGTEITCAGTFASTDTELSGWTIGDDLIIQVYDFGTADTDTSFCLEEFTLPTCLDPISLASANITQDSADLSWAQGGTETDWEYTLLLATDPAPTTSGTATMAASYNATSLSSSTDYVFYVRADCGGGDLSEWVSTSFSTLIPPPANDECGSAIGLTVNADYSCGTVTAGTTSGATASAQADDVTGTPNTDVWFSFVATSTDHRVELQSVVNQGGGTSTSTDMGMGVYDGTGGCAGLVFFDDSDPNSLDLTGLSIGVTYYVRVYGWFTSVQYNNFDICVGTAPACLEPVTLASANITQDSADLSWAQGGTETDWEYVLLLATDPAPTGAGTATMATSYNATSLASETDYVFYVRADCGGGDFSTWASTAFSTTGPPPANDDCAGAIAIVPSTTGAEVWTTGTTAFNTASGEVTDTDISCTGSFAFGSGRDVWFTTEVPAAGNITITTQASGGSALDDTIMSVWSGTCGALAGTEIGCNDDGGTGNFSEVALTGLTPGDILYIRVQEYASSASKGPDDGTFEIATHDPNPVLSIDDNVIEGFAIYPNPVNDMLRFNAQDDIESISIYNLLGQEVLRTQPRVSNAEVNMSNLSAGMYVVKVQIGEQLGSYRIIKE